MSTDIKEAEGDRIKRLKKKQKSLSKSGMSFVEIKALRKMLTGLGPQAQYLGCMPHDCRISIEMYEDGAARIVIRNRVNKKTIDETNKAKAIEEKHPMYASMIGDFLDILKDMAEYWKIPNHRVHFVAWLQGPDQTSEDLRNLKLRVIVKPKSGFPPTERIVLK